MVSNIPLHCDAHGNHMMHVSTVNVMPSCCRVTMQDDKYKCLIALGVAAVGGSAVMGVNALDAQRLKIIVSNMGPSQHPFAPIQTPNTMPEQPQVALAAAPAVPTAEAHGNYFSSNTQFTCDAQYMQQYRQLQQQHQGLAAAVARSCADETSTSQQTHQSQQVYTGHLPVS